MKWLGAGVTFFNLATVAGLLLGILARGLTPAIAAVSLLFGAAMAFYLLVSHGSEAQIVEPGGKTKGASRKTDAKPESGFIRYRSFWKWAMAACFAAFALRCFCWLLYIDGEELRIQSPNNLGDLALHITHIRYFANGVPLWPANPIYAFSAHLRYPAGADLFNGLLSCLNVDLMQGLIWVGLLASMATFYAFYRWGGAFAVAGFLFNGGIAGFQVLSSGDWKAYQDVPSIAWKSIPHTMFLTQRGLLYAIPAGLLLLWNWRTKYFRLNAASEAPNTQAEKPLPFWVDLSVYASMPLFHVHAFMALTIVLLCLGAFQLVAPITRVVDLVREEGGAGVRPVVSEPGRWKRFFPIGEIGAAVLLGAAFVPATFFMWLITDHFRAGSVFEWHPGWVQDDGEMAAPFFRLGPTDFGSSVPVVGWLLRKTWNGLVAPLFQFWLTNFGILVPLVLMLLGIYAWRLWKSEPRRSRELDPTEVFLSAAVIIFALGYFVKMAPWGWDNLKVMVWAYFIVLPFLWKDLIARWMLPMRVAICVLLFWSGFVSLFGGLADGRPGYGFVNRAELDGVGGAVRRLPVEARFAAYPTYNHPLLLQGRKVALGYTGHLWTQGFEDYGKAEQSLRQLMQGVTNWADLAHSFHVRYIFWGREEKTNYIASTRPWERSAAVVATGPWGSIYDLEQPPVAPPQR
jgi:hypothetical protein